MRKTTFIRTVELPVPREEAFAWHCRGGALARMIPPWENVEVLSGAGAGIEDGRRVELIGRTGPLACRWVVEHRDCVEGRSFRDVALRSPFAHWDHLHRFEDIDARRCRLEDHIEYALPGGETGRLLAAAYVERQLQRMFRYRHDTLHDDLAAHARFARQPPLRICVTGASGLVGSALVPFLTSGGHTVLLFTRKAARDNRINVGDPARGDPVHVAWDPMRGEFHAEACEAADAVVHLSGENLATGRWSEEKKRRIRDSRVIVTQRLCEKLARLKRPPRVLLSAAAVGVYGSSGDEFLDESAPEGGGFLPDVCRRWEAATEPAQEAGIRVVRLRFGAVLTPRGGMLAKLLPLFRLGLAGRQGDGRHQQSWISIDDALGAIHHAIMDDTLAGPVNLVSPNPATNAAFTSTLAEILRRPAFLHAPPWALRAALGEMADELLLSSIRAVPKRLAQSGYSFRHATLAAALRHVLGRHDD